MSLLLEALKKAALKKRDNEAAAKNNSDDEMLNRAVADAKENEFEKTESELADSEQDRTAEDRTAEDRTAEDRTAEESAAEESALQKKNARDKWLEQSEKSASKHRVQNRSQNQSQNQIPPSEADTDLATKVVHPESQSVDEDPDDLNEIDLNENELNESNQIESDQIENDQIESNQMEKKASSTRSAVNSHSKESKESITAETDSISIGNIEFVSDQFSETEISELTSHDEEELVLDANELEVLDSEDELGEEIDLVEENLELEIERDARTAESKTAMAELLERSHRVVRRTRRREIFLYIFFFLTAVGSVGSYYYYLSFNDYSLQISKLSSAEEAQIAEHQQSSRLLISADTAENDVNRNEVEVVTLAPQTVASQTLASQTVAAINESNSANDIAAIDTASIGTTSIDTAPIETTAIETAPISTATLSSRSPATPNSNGVFSLEEASSGDFILTRKISSQVTAPSEHQIELNRIVKQGFDAYQRGDWSESRREYAEALRMAPMDRDALLGAAALASLEGRWQDAIRLYQTRLIDYPSDEFAKAGLLSLASLDAGNPDLKRDIQLMLEEFPDAPYLHFIKGAVHAGENEWGSAQKAFFDAYYLDRFNADYAFNLAVSMDHLGQKLEAKRYYLLALQLQSTKAANFDSQVVETRLSELEAER